MSNDCDAYTDEMALADAAYEGAVIVEIKDLREIVALIDVSHIKQKKGTGGAREAARAADLLDDIVNWGIKYGPVTCRPLEVKK